MDPTKQFIQDLIRNELAYINTRHPDFSDARHQVHNNLYIPDIYQVQSDVYNDPHPYYNVLKKL